MTEAEWLACNDPTPMLDWLTGRIPPPSERKIRLLLAGCARQVWDRIPPREMREAVEIAERYADGTAALEELSRSRGRYYDPDMFGRVRDRNEFLIYCLAYASSASARIVARPHGMTNWVGVSALTAECLPHLLRCVFGNPFLPVAVDPRLRTAAIVSLAEGIYQDRAFDRLPILADALEDAGCDDADVLAHCRGEGPHVRGCWVVDLLLGKE